MIATLTPNPSFDRTLTVDKLVPGQFHRSTDSTIEAGGKGINVSRALATAGSKSRCIFPAPTETAGRLVSLVKVGSLIEIAVVESSRPVRHNTTVTDASGETTKVNERGETPDEADLEALVSTSARAAVGCEWFVVAGSLPFGVDPNFYQRIADAIEPSGALLAVDSSGPALAAAVSAGCALIKPNTAELAELVERPLITLGDVIAAARSTLQAGVTQVLVSLGPDGAILVTKETVAHATTAPTVVRNTVGAGDAALAGFLFGGGRGSGALVAAVAWGRSAVRSPGTSMQAPSVEEHQTVSVAAPDYGYELEST